MLDAFRAVLKIRVSVVRFLPLDTIQIRNLRSLPFFLEPGVLRPQPRPFPCVPVSVPARRLPASHTAARLKLRLRRSTFDHVPSVITDICGSTSTNIRIVAVPFTTADRMLAVTRSAEFRYPAYSDAKTPVVQRAI